MTGEMALRSCEVKSIILQVRINRIYVEEADFVTACIDLTVISNNLYRFVFA